MVLNTIARRVIEDRRGINKEYVFTYRGSRLGKLNNSAWKRGWQLAGLPIEKGIMKGVHNLRHTFGRRLRSAGIPLEIRKALLGHTVGDITTHYSADLSELLKSADAIVSRSKIETPNLTLVGQKAGKTVGKVSEIKKELTNKIG